MSRGYHGDPSLTARKFTTVGGRRWFRSGDLARWGSDGCLYFAGRTDDQVQIRGVRVEPAEVTRAVRKLPGISDARVASSTDPATGQGRLRCHVVAETEVGDQDGQITRWRAELARWLPRQMIPEDWTLTNRLPVTVSGKWERPQSPREGSGQEARGEDGAALAMLRDQWSAVLGTSSVPDDASFFDLGGHSISAIKLLNLVRESFGRDYPMSDFFQDPTVRGMAAWLAQGAGADQPGRDSERTRGEL